MKIFWIITYLSVFTWSAVNPHDYFTWFLEVVPAMIGVVVLAMTYKSFPLTRLAYVLILLHCIILMVGGHYTYAEVPLFDWIRESFDLGRNNYDKVGHFAQGFVPAIIAREILVRKDIIQGKVWLNFFIVCFALSFSAFYELIEWFVAITSGESAEAFLGTQGYVWDTQSDMGLALLGAVLSLMILSQYHDDELVRKGYVRNSS